MDSNSSISRDALKIIMSRAQDGDGRHYHDSREHCNERKGHYHRSHYVSDPCEDRPRKRLFLLTLGFKEEHPDAKHDSYYEGYEGRHGHRRSHSRSDHSEYYRGHRSEHSRDARTAKEPSPSRKPETPSESNKAYGTGKVSEAATKETLVSSTLAQSNVEPMTDAAKVNVENPEPSAFNKEEPQESPLTELLANLRKTVETPLEVAGRMTEQLAETPSMRHSLLLAIVRVKQGSFGKAVHAEHWKKDVKWMKQELSSLVALDRQRLERRRQELLAGGESAAGELKVVPKVRYWGRGGCVEESRAIARRLRQMAEEDGKAELEIAQKEKHLAEMKLQIAKTELKAKLIDLKIAKRLA